MTAIMTQLIGKTPDDTEERKRFFQAGLGELKLRRQAVSFPGKTSALSEAGIFAWNVLANAQVPDDLTTLTNEQLAAVASDANYSGHSELLHRCFVESNRRQDPTRGDPLCICPTNHTSPHCPVHGAKRDPHQKDKTK